MEKLLWKLPPNRVRRNYMGGAGIDRLHGMVCCRDNDRPEEWIGSMVEASNPGLTQIPGEGLAKVELDGKNYILRDIIDRNRDFYLGEDNPAGEVWQLSFLYKILDSSMRLHVQAHPSSEFAQRVLHKPYGKLECYYILSVREGTSPYIRLGFQHAPTRAAWKEIIERQDIEAMDACFEKIPVKPGEVWYIPGGMPHAIGENITMLEIMEPSDLVVRCEFEREGVFVPEAARFMGRDLDFCLDIFDYDSYSVEYLKDNFRIQPQIEQIKRGYQRELLVGKKLTDCFEVRHHEVLGTVALQHSRKMTLGVVVEGEGTLASEEEYLKLKSGDSFMVAASAETLSWELAPGKNKLSYVTVEPGPAMRMPRAITL